jgi:hypothetical protein
VEDDRTKLRRLSQEALNTLRGSVEERVWELFELILARLTRLETGEFPVEEVPTKPAKRFSSTEKGLTPASFPAVKESGAKWSSEEVIELLERGRQEAGLDDSKGPK